VFGAEVFMRSTSVWVVGCSAGSSGLLVFVPVGRGSVDACRWVV
jgi:hypothetical protein